LYLERGLIDTSPHHELVEGVVPKKTNNDSGKKCNMKKIDIVGHMLCHKNYHPLNNYGPAYNQVELSKPCTK
jgi:hypothetical protein